MDHLNKHILSDSFVLLGITSGSDIIISIENSDGSPVEAIPIELYDSILSGVRHNTEYGTLYCVWDTHMINKRNERLVPNELPILFMMHDTESKEVKWMGIVNNQRRVIYSRVSPFHSCIIQNQVIVREKNRDLILDFDGREKFSAKHIRVSQSGYHFFNNTDNLFDDWKILTPEYQVLSIDCDGYPSSDSLNDVFDQYGLTLYGNNLINNKGKMIIADVESYTYDKDHQILEVSRRINDRNHSYIYSRSGRPLFERCNSFWDTDDHYRSIVTDQYLFETLTIVKYGIINSDFSVFLPLCFDSITPTEVFPDGDRGYIVRLDNKVGLLSSKKMRWIAKPHRMTHYMIWAKVSSFSELTSEEVLLE